MTRRPDRIRHIVLFGAILATACSEEAAGPGNDTEASAVDMAVLFADGFREAGKQPDAQKPRETAYRPDESLRGKVGHQMAGDLRRTFSMAFANPEPEQFLRSGAAIDVANRKLEALGLATDDLASASVLMFGLAWELANQEKLTPERQKALVRQVAQQLKTPRTDDAFQLEADTRLMIAGVWLEEARLRHGSPDRMRELSDAVQRDMKRMSGNDMRAHDVQADGFVER